MPCAEDGWLSLSEIPGLSPHSNFGLLHRSFGSPALPFPHPGDKRLLSSHPDSLHQPNLRSWVTSLDDIIGWHQKSCKIENEGSSLGVQWLRLCDPSAGGPGSISGQGTRSCMSYLVDPECCSEDGRPWVLRLRPSGAKQICLKKIENGKIEGWGSVVKQIWKLQHLIPSSWSFPIHPGMFRPLRCPMVRYLLMFI